MVFTFKIRLSRTFWFDIMFFGLRITRFKVRILAENKFLLQILIENVVSLDLTVYTTESSILDYKYVK